MEDRDQKEYVANLAKAETEDEKKGVETDCTDAGKTDKAKSGGKTNDKRSVIEIKRRAKRRGRKQSWEEKEG